MPKDSKVIVSGVNIATRHRKPTQLNPQGGLERKEAPMHVSKVAIADPKTGKATRVRFETKAARRSAWPPSPGSRSMADEKKVEEAAVTDGSRSARRSRSQASNLAEGRRSPGRGEDGRQAFERRRAIRRVSRDYDDRIAKAMTEKFGYKNALEVPRLDKIVINMGVGEATQDKKKVEQAAAEMEKIAGQKPVITKAKKSIAQFKLREGMPIGCKVTLRRERMYEFLDRLVTIALPRVRDFRGLNPKSFDGRGNYAMGLKEQIVFPEINYDQIDKVRGMDIIITTTAKTDEEARELLRLFNFPFPAEAEKAAAQNSASPSPRTSPSPW